MINTDALSEVLANFHGAKPFDHACIDGFFDESVARELEREFPDFESDAWHRYNNPLEVKRACNDWRAFGPTTYRALNFLNGSQFVQRLGLLTNLAPLYADCGLNGGGLHIHARGGKLNVHKDYETHPKLGLDRKLNLIVYLNSEWRDEWGGALGLWKGSEDRPDWMVKALAPKFNRAVIFDTSQNSWHGLPYPIDCPEGQYRKSLAVYYLTEPQGSTRTKALFAPTAEQEGDPEIAALIQRRLKGQYA